MVGLPWWWWALVVGLVVAFVVILWMLINHLAKVDDLAHGLNADLHTAEADIVKLKADVASLMARQPVRGPGGRFVAQTDSDAHSYGRHAHSG